MKTQLRLVVFTAVLAFALTARAQVTYTNTDNGGMPTPVDAFVFTAVQTFSGFSNLSSVSWSMTNTGGSPTTTTFNAYVAEWNTGTNMVTGSLTAFGDSNTSLNLGPAATIMSTDLLALTFSDNWTPVNPSLTYALILTYTGGDSGIVANTGINPSDAFFGSGGAGLAPTSFVPGGLSGLQSDLQTFGASIDNSSAYAMSVTGTLATLAPVPEPKTAAAGIAALFVAALIGRRTWQRRKLVPIPVVA